MTATKLYMLRVIAGHLATEGEAPAIDLGRVVHEVPAEKVWQALEQEDHETDEDDWYCLQLWEEDENSRYLLDEREIPESLADKMLDGKLADLLPLT